MAERTSPESLFDLYQRVLDSDRIRERRGLTLTTPRLRLRLPIPDDLEFLASLEADPDVMRYIHKGPATEEVSRSDAESTIVFGAFRRSFHKWIVETQDNATRLGWVELTKFSQGRSRSDLGDDIQIGYEFATQAWGQGYATESCRAVIEYAFDRCQLGQLVAFARLDNLRSLNVLRKLGFKQDGVCRDDAKVSCPFFVLHSQTQD